MITKANEERFDKVYSFLVDETENRDTIYSKQRRERLADLLELMEYLRGEDDENPLEKWFPAGS